MYHISQLQKQLENPVFFANQFKLKGKTNILYVEPQLSAKHLYKSIFPFFYIFDAKRDDKDNLTEVNTNAAFTGIDKFNPQQQLVSIHTIITEEQIKWADWIVFPFTCCDLLDEYEKIRINNPKCKIAYHVDFNFYEIHDKHPYKRIIDKLPHVEMNILSADLCITANKELQSYLLKKMAERIKEKKIPNKTKFHNIPPFIDPYLCNLTIDDEPPMSRLSVVPKKKPQKKIIKKGRASVKKIDDTQVVYEPITVSIIYSHTYNEYYKQFNSVLQQLPEHVTLVIIGYNPDDDKEQVFKGVKYEYIKPCSIIHFFKQLFSIKPDFCLIPVSPDNFSITSETGNRYLECGIFGIPLIAPNCFPYNVLVKDNFSGYLFNDKSELIEKIKSLSTMMPHVRSTISPAISQDVLSRYTWSKKNVDYYMQGFKI